MAKKSKNSPIFELSKPWDSNTNPIWLGTALKLYRNVDKFSFPGKLSTDRRKQILSLIKKAITNCNKLSNPVIINAEDTSPNEKEYLFEHFLSMHGFHQAHEGEALVFDDSNSVLGVLNIRDHLQLQAIDTTGEIEQAWNNLIAIEMAIGQEVTYAFNDSYGFLTADPATCGTGMVIYAFLQVPALIHAGSLSTILSKHSLEGIASTGLQGDPNHLIGDVVVLYNSCTLGMTEENTVTMLRSALTRLFIEEKSARSKIREDSDSHFKDHVSRAFGLLMHSYQTETVEALNAISLLKLGLELEWIGGTSIEALNRLFFGCRRGHLLARSTEELDSDVVLHKRAELIHKTLKSAKLKI
ncbi:Protein-arginine kinase [Chlamydiales bacterium SCGC AG-110-P3]|nr:Protein-arginine kinase [Chlamydiales bacterium SCGC AG-110-P3]